MMWALLIYCVASVGSAFTNDWPTFLGCRIIAGIGTGAELRSSRRSSQNLWRAGSRGRFTGSLAGFFSFGFVGAALLGYFIVPVHPEAWRWVLVLTAVPIETPLSVAARPTGIPVLAHQHGAFI